MILKLIHDFRGCASRRDATLSPYWATAAITLTILSSTMGESHRSLAQAGDKPESTATASPPYTPVRPPELLPAHGAYSPEARSPEAPWLVPGMPARVIYSAVTVTPASYLPPGASRKAREARVAQLENALYKYVERPHVLGKIDAEIQVAEAEVSSHQRVLEKYAAFTRFSHSDPLLVTIERTRLGLVEAKTRLQFLRAERSRYLRYARTARAIDELRSEDRD